MKKHEALEHFYEHHFKPVLLKNMDLLEVEFFRNQVNLITAFENSFRDLCLLILDMQKKQEKDPIGYIHYSLMRTSILKRTYQYRVEAYSNKWYLDDVECMIPYDVSWAYGLVTSMIESLEEKQKQYMGLLNSSDVEYMVLGAVEFFHQFVVSLIRSAVHRVVQSPEYQAIYKADRLAIRIGEYKDSSEAIFIDDQIPRDESCLNTALTEDKEGACIYENFRNVTSSGLEIVGRDLRYNDFSNSILSGNKFIDCILVGTQWRRADLKGIKFNGSLLSDADFSESDLRYAQFDGVSGKALQEGANRVPGLLGIHFNSANLDGANFANVLSFDHVYFEGASMQGTVLSAKYKDKFVLSESQIHSIHWID